MSNRVVWTELPSCITSFPKLANLDLRRCHSLQNVDVLTNLSNLIELYVDYSNSPVRPKNGEMTTRKQVEEYQDKIRLFMALRDGDTELLNDYKDCTSIDLSGCKSLKNVDGLANCRKLTSIDLSWCDSLQNVDGLANCNNLTNLDLNRCSSLQNVDGLASLTGLTYLTISKRYDDYVFNPSEGDSWTMRTNDGQPETIPNYEAVLVLVRNLLK